MRRRFFWCVLLAALVTGCGSSSNFVFLSEAPPGPQPVTPPARQPSLRVVLNQTQARTVDSSIDTFRLKLLVPPSPSNTVVREEMFDRTNNTPTQVLELFDVADGRYVCRLELLSQNKTVGLFERPVICRAGEVVEIIDPDYFNAFQISGRITQGRGESAVANTVVKAFPQGNGFGDVAVSDDSGFYSLSVSTGVFDVIGDQEGFAQTSYQMVQVDTGDRTEMNMLQFRRLSPDLALTSPVLSFTGITPGQSINAPTNVAVTATGLRTTELTVRLAPANDTSVYAGVRDSDVLDFDISPGTLPPGPGFLIVDARDLNSNTTRLSIPLLFGMGTNPIPVTVGPVSTRAETFARGGSSYRALEGGSPGLPGHGAATVNSALARGVPPDTAVQIQITWNTNPPGATGVRISRATDINGPYKPVINMSDPSFRFVFDTDPELTIGETYFYQVQAYNDAGIGDPMTSGGSTVLDRFELNLAAPANNLTGVGLAPTFRWTFNAVGETQDFTVFAREILANPGALTFTSSVQNIGELSSPVTLAPNTNYVWDVEGVAFQNDMSAVSYAPILYQGVSTARNGPFNFTTQLTP